MTDNSHQVALWAGIAAFFGSVLAVGAFDLLDTEGWAEFLSALLVAAFTAGAVYSRQRLNDAKRQQKGGTDGDPTPPV